MSYDKPIPVLHGEERIYFEEARNHRLVYQRCDDCGAAVFYLRTVCPSCTSESLSIVAAAGNGEIYSFTTHYRAANPSFADDVPYTIVLVDMPEGIRVLADLVECPPEQVRVGMAVEVLFDDVTEELTLPRFRPSDSGERP